MNKHGWTYKKLGEACQIIMGQSPQSEFYNDNGEGLPFFQGCSDFGIIHPVAKVYCSNPSKIALPLDVLMSVRAPIGSLNIANVKCCIGRGIASFRQIENVSIYKYLYYILQASEKKLQNMGTGSTFKAIGKNSLQDFIIPLPSIKDQKAIVAELDEINETIELLKQQVADLDNLEQSTFYSMFGDPVTNERGWSVKKLGELSEIVRGGSPRPISMFLGGTIPWIKIGDATKGDDIYLSRTKEFIIQEGLSKTRCIPEGSMIFANCGVSLGFARIIKFEGCIHDGWLAFMNIDESTVSKLFLLKSLNHCTHYFRSLAPEGTQPNLNTSIMKAFKQIIPPFALQQEFAAKVEAMESAKAELNAQIAEMQTLLASRMDYYFD